MKRQWVKTKDRLPEEGQKVYYFCDFLGIFRGEFHIIKSSYANPNKFSSNHGVLDPDEVTHWMLYDHSLRDIIPLPPEYKGVDIHGSQSIINSGLDLHYDEIDIAEEQRQMFFSCEVMSDL